VCVERDLEVFEMIGSVMQPAFPHEATIFYVLDVATPTAEQNIVTTIGELLHRNQGISRCEPSDVMYIRYTETMAGQAADSFNSQAPSLADL
jgi:hypothetical protein